MTPNNTANSAIGALIYIKLLLVSALWGLTFIIGQEVVQELPPVSSVFIRFFIAGVVMVFFLLYRYKRQNQNTFRAYFPQNRADLLLVGVLAFFGVLLYNVSFMIALIYLPVTRVSTIVPTSPVFLMLLAWLIYREPLSLIRIIGSLLAVIGAMIVINKGSFLVFSKVYFSRYDLWPVLSSVSWGLYVLFSKNFLKRYGALEMNTWVFIVGTVMLGLTLPFLGDFSVLFPKNAWSIQVIIGLLIMGVGSSALALIWYFEGLHTIGIIRSSVFISLVPVMTMFEAFLFLDERILISDWIGAILVGVGVYWVNYHAPIKRKR